MAFKSITQMISDADDGAAPHRRRPTNQGVNLAIATDCAIYDGRPAYRMRLALTRNLAKQARMIPGDRVDILFDREAGRGLLQRVTEGGWKLGGGQHSANARLTLALAHRPGMPSIAEPTECTGIEVTDAGIEFTLPEGVSFTENLREQQMQEAVSDVV